MRTPIAFGFAGSGNPTDPMGLNGSSGSPSSSNDQTSIINYLASIDNSLKQLASTLAPDNQLMTKVPIVNQAANATGLSPQILRPYNYIINGINAGIVNVWFGGSKTSTVPDLVLNPVTNPTPIPIPFRSDQQVYWEVSSGSPTNANGNIWICRM